MYIFILNLFLNHAYAVTGLDGVIFNPKLITPSNFSYDQNLEAFKDSEGNQLTIREEKIKANEAEKMLKQRLVQLKLLYVPKVAAYPGMITTTESCAKKYFYPQKIKESSTALYWTAEMPATKEMIYGSCGTMKEPFWSQQQLLFCKKTSTLWDVRYFHQQKDFKKHFSSPIASCK